MDIQAGDQRGLPTPPDERESHPEISATIDKLLSQIRGLPESEAEGLIADLTARLNTLKAQQEPVPEKRSAVDDCRALIREYRSLPQTETITLQTFEGLSGEEKRTRWQILLRLARFLVQHKTSLSAQYLDEYQDSLQQIDLFGRLEKAILDWDSTQEKPSVPNSYSHKELLSLVIIAAEALNHPLNIPDPERPLKHMEDSLTRLRRDTQTSIRLSPDLLLDNYIQGQQKEQENISASVRAINAILQRTTDRIAQSTAYRGFTLSDPPDRQQVTFVEGYIEEVHSTQQAVRAYTSICRDIKGRRSALKRMLGGQSESPSAEEIDQWVKTNQGLTYFFYGEGSTPRESMQVTQESISAVVEQANNVDATEMASQCSAKDLYDLKTAVMRLKRSLQQLQEEQEAITSSNNRVFLQGYSYVVDMGIIAPDGIVRDSAKPEANVKKAYTEFLAAIDRVDSDPLFWGEWFTDRRDNAVDAFWKMVFVGMTHKKQDRIPSLLSLMRSRTYTGSELTAGERYFHDLQVQRTLGILLGCKIAHQDRAYLPQDFEATFLPDNHRLPEKTRHKIYDRAEVLYDLWVDKTATRRQ